MISIADRSKLKSQTTFTNVLALGGLATLLISVVLPYFKVEFGQISSGLMLGGIVLSIIGIYFANRWVRKPRPETSLETALKKYSNSYRLYHYSSLPCDHILLSPYGITLFHTINWEGVFKYKKGRWREYINFGRAIRFLLEQHLGDPTTTALSVEQAMRDLFRKQLGDNNDLLIHSVIVFLHPRARLEIENPSPVPVCMVDGLRKHIPAKGMRIPEELYNQIKLTLDGHYKPGMELKI